MSTIKKRDKKTKKETRDKRIKKKNEQTVKDEIERNKYVLDLVNSWIINADNKIEKAFAILSVVLALVVFVAGDLLSGIETTSVNSCLMLFFHVFVVLTGILFLASVWFYIQCIIPRFTKDDSMNKEYSLFYDEIKDYARHEEYIKACKRVNDEIYNEEIIKEIFFNSRICSKKMKNFRRGIVLSGLSIAFSVVAVLVYYFAVT